MGCSHAVHLIMNINMTVVGRVFLASSRVGDAARDLADLQSMGVKYTENRSSTLTIAEYYILTVNGESVVISIVVVEFFAIAPSLILYDNAMKPDADPIYYLSSYTYSADLLETGIFVTG